MMFMFTGTVSFVTAQMERQLVTTSLRASKVVLMKMIVMIIDKWRERII